MEVSLLRYNSGRRIEKSLSLTISDSFSGGWDDKSIESRIKKIEEFIGDLSNLLVDKNILTLNEIIEIIPNNYQNIKDIQKVV